MPSPAFTTRLYSIWGALLVILVFGSWLRLDQISGQWLTDDEWHALHQIIEGRSYADLASMVGEADFSIPQTLAYKFLAEHGGLSEIRMRLPMLLAGLALVGGGAWWAWHRFGALVGGSFGLLLAISPLLVNYSRTARPYALTVLLAWAALLALDRWSQERRTGLGSVYAGCAILACWLHMAVAPFILAPLGWVLLGELRAAWRTRDLSRAGPAALLGLTVAAGIMVLAIRPIWLSRTVFVKRIGSDLPTFDTYLGVWYLWLGTSSTAVVVAGLLLAACGLPLLVRRNPRLLAFAALGLVATVSSIYVTRPSWVQNVLTFGRYLLPAQPLLLLCVALGIARLLAPLSHPVLRAAGAVLLPIVFLIGSPYPELLRHPNNFTLHYLYQFDYRNERNPVREGFAGLPVHSFWRRFGEVTPGSLRFAVAGHGLESFTVLDARWQEEHHQEVIAAQLSGYCGVASYPGEALERDGIYLRNAVTLADAGALARKQVDYLVFDRQGARNVESCIAHFRSEHGAPEVDDDRLVAFKLKPAR